MGGLCKERCEEDRRGGRLEEEDRRQRRMEKNSRRGSEKVAGSTSPRADKGKKRKRESRRKNISANLCILYILIMYLTSVYGFCTCI